MTASSDYGVSIVESFTPPKNWLSGQTINKDVYAVNTGNVDAFVEETVSGRLTITKEEATTALTDKSIKLTEAERYVVEAGAFLAYKPENSNAELGKKVVSMVPDSTDLNGYEALNEPLTDFTPDAPGLYVFRRTIGVDPETRVEKYTYDGYYYVKGLDDVSKVQVKEAADAVEHANQYKWVKADDNTAFKWTDDQTAPEGYEPVYVDDTITEHDAIPGGFYKISNLKVTYPGLTLAGDADQTDGVLKTAEAGFCEDKTYVVDPVDLKYDAENNRLVASYYTGKELDFSDNDGSLPKLAKAYDDALVAYEDALEEYRAAIRDQAGTNATLAEEYNDLQKALDDLQAAINAETKANDDLQKAIKKEENTNNALIEAQSNKDAADAAVTAAQQAYDDADLANQAALADVGNASSGKTKAYNEAQADVEAQQALLEAEADSARDAFVQYLVDKGEIIHAGTEPTDEEIKTYFNNVTYEHLHDDLAIVNDGGVEYRYYEKLVELKRLEKERDAKKTELEAAQAAQRVTAQNLATAQAALDAAKEAQTAAGSDLADATNAHDTAVNELGTSSAANDGTDTTAHGVVIIQLLRTVKMQRMMLRPQEVNMMLPLQLLELILIR